MLFASGAAALVYQVLWVKQLSLVVGIEVYAVTTAVAAFCAGLALGGVLFGRRVDRTARAANVALAAVVPVRNLITSSALVPWSRYARRARRWARTAWAFLKSTRLQK